MMDESTYSEYLKENFLEHVRDVCCGVSIPEVVQARNLSVSYITRWSVAIQKHLNSIRSMDLMHNLAEVEGDDFSPEGYRYVCSRIRDPNITAREKRDLLQVKAIYEIWNERNMVVRHLHKGHYSRAVRIMNRRLTA